MKKAWRKFLVTFLVLWLFSLFTDYVRAAPPGLPIEVKAKGVAVAELSTGRLLYGQNAQDFLPMASTTKIMSALIVLEQPNLDELFVVDSQAIRVEGSSMGLQEGDLVSLRTLVCGMLLPSGNDAANAAAVRVSGSIPAFVALMNRRAKEMGLDNTYFVTPSGLHGDGHGSTAADMAKLTAEALKNPEFASICSKSSMKVRFGNPPYDRWLTNHNRLLKLYGPAIGVKTGYTKAAGRCLISAAKREDGAGLIVVTLGCADDWNVHENLYRSLLPDLVQEEEPALALQGQVAGGEQQQVDLDWIMPQVHGMPWESLEVVASYQRILFAPLEKGQVVGTVDGYYQGQEVFSVPLVTAESCQRREEKGFLWW